MHPPPHFFGCAITFEVVAPQAARHQVFPRVFSTARARDDVVNGGGLALAVCAPGPVSPKHSASGDGDASLIGKLDVSSEHDDGGALEWPRNRPHRVVVISFNDDCAVVHHQHQGPAERHHRQRFVSGVEHQGSGRRPSHRRCSFCKGLGGGHLVTPRTTKKALPMSWQCPALSNGRHPSMGGWPAECIRK